ncbi:AbiH family protein [Vibrio vulnificus]|uniref:AbiH family protein n=1 Tax=Vibrio vulnificus TaxID=672 RepID=UPI0040585C5E
MIGTKQGLPAKFEKNVLFIRDKAEFFYNLKNINEVIISGYSLADVDLPYFEHLSKSVSPEAKWTATYYAEEEQSSHLFTLTNLGIQNVSVVKFEDL